MNFVSHIVFILYVCVHNTNVELTPYVFKCYCTALLLNKGHRVLQFAHA